MRILIVEDDAALARGIAASLRLSGFAVDHDPTGADVVHLLRTAAYAAVVLDLGLPGRSGFEVLREIRRAGFPIPVMILTARAAVADRVTGLDLGADDYLAKPFDPAELEARVRALVRRASGQPDPILTCDALVLDRSGQVATLAGKVLPLRKRELAILESLMTRAGRVVSKERLTAEVFGFDEEISPNAIEVYVARLRRHFGETGPRIVTMRGLGYVIEPSRTGTGP
ncbi:response regulator [Methylobacterium isbiliense]|jgi:two-component system response regulator TctD|uniref:Transcriptional regulatory protein tctD n=1 Tax=Methylobacterium isbiliense TaxID=315478 RepID=A0ABQ4S547_9HYPH|nr:response regulator transcription factor [Methylobacterium isbiliense]MDN3623129.1 response regulator transcription factor [Methylobacterium isbiliense]GJD98199.1 Transcriptional regulatory protein tctD [Methylobacterium isbiliense]